MIEDSCSLKVYSRFYLMQYKSLVKLKDGNIYLALFQRKFELCLPEGFKAIPKGKNTEEVLNFVEPIEAEVHFYKIRSTKEVKESFDKNKYVFSHTQLAKLSKSLPDKKRKLLISYYGRICRSKFYLKFLTDEGKDFKLKAPDKINFNLISSH